MLSLLICLLNGYFVYAFSFTHSSPTQCGDLNIEWSGGNPPFQLLVIPQYSIPSNITIPASAFNDGKGSYSTPLQLNETSKFVLTMSDSTGFGSGGNSELLVVAPANGATCDLTLPKLGFTYDAKDALQQCRPFEFSLYKDAVQPINIMGVIPGGQSFVLKPPMGSSSFSWTANIYNGTTVVFLVTDSLSRQGGSSDFYTVLASGDASCIDNSSPSSTINATPSGTPTSTTDSNPSPSSTPTSGTPISVIAGTVIGALIFLAVGVTLGLFFLKKFRDRKNTWSPNSLHRESLRRSHHTDLDLMGNDAPYTPSYYLSHPSFGSPSSANQSSYPLFSPFPQPDSLSLAPSPYATTLSPAPYAASTSTYSNNIDPFSPATTTTTDPFTAREPNRDTMSSAQRKAAMAGATQYKPARFILHTDIEDTVPPDTGEDEVVELPPQYTERRNVAGPSKPNDHSPPHPPAPL